MGQFFPKDFGFSSILLPIYNAVSIFFSVIANTNEESMNQLNIEDSPKDEGPKPFAKIDLVSEGSPADDAGLKVGDLVIEFGTQNATNFKSLAEIGQLVQN